MSMMKKSNNLFVNEDDFEDEVVEREEVRQEQPKPRVVKKENQVQTKANVQSQPAGRTNNVILTEPLVFADSKDIVDDIKRNKVVIINLSKLDVETSDRLLDFMVQD